jgi:hypothetical protein
MTRLLSEREFRSVTARGPGTVMGVTRSRVAAGPQRPLPRPRPATRTPQPTNTDATFAAAGREPAQAPNRPGRVGEGRQRPHDPPTVKHVQE